MNIHLSIHEYNACICELMYTLNPDVKLNCVKFLLK